MKKTKKQLSSHCPISTSDIRHSDCHFRISLSLHPPPSNPTSLSLAYQLLIDLQKSNRVEGFKHDNLRVLNLGKHGTLARFQRLANVIMNRAGYEDSTMPCCQLHPSPATRRPLRFVVVALNTKDILTLVTVPAPVHTYVRMDGCCCNCVDEGHTCSPRTVTCGCMTRPPGICIQRIGTKSSLQPSNATLRSATLPSQAGGNMNHLLSFAHL